MTRAIEKPREMLATTSLRTLRRTDRRRADRRVAITRGTLGALGLVAILEFVSRSGIVSQEFLPPFSVVVVQTVQLFGELSFLQDVAATVLTWFLGLGLASLIGVPLGILLGLSAPTYRATRAVIELVRPMPAVALIPLVLLFVGQGLEMKLIVAIYGALWPILFNTIYGVRGVDPKAKEMARSFGLGRLNVTRRVVLPGAGPFIATGIRISSSIVLIVIITVELIAGGTDGLGSFIAQNRAAGNAVTRVYAGILVTGLLGVTINLLLGRLERQWFRWNATTRNAR